MKFLVNLNFVLQEHVYPSITFISCKMMFLFYIIVIFYLGQAFFLVCSVLICAILVHNFKTEVSQS